MAFAPGPLGHEIQLAQTVEVENCRLETFVANLVLDVFSRECVGIAVDFKVTAKAATAGLNNFTGRRRAKPRAVTLDNGTEFRSLHFDAWAYGRGIELDFIQSGKPNESAFIESLSEWGRPPSGEDSRWLVWMPSREPGRARLPLRLDEPSGQPARAHS